jgi:hypothetical protein
MPVGNRHHPNTGHIAAMQRSNATARSASAMGRRVQALCDAGYGAEVGDGLAGERLN